MEIATMIIAIITLLVGMITLMVSVPTIFSLTSDIKKYINVIDCNFVTRYSGKRKLHESTLKCDLEAETDPELRALRQAFGRSLPAQKYAEKGDEELMSQCSMLFSKQVDAWHINHFWFVKHIINRQLDKYDKQIETAQASMVEEAKKRLGSIFIRV